MSSQESVISDGVGRNYVGEDGSSERLREWWAKHRTSAKDSTQESRAGSGSLPHVVIDGGDQGAHAQRRMEERTDPAPSKGRTEPTLITTWMTNQPSSPGDGPQAAPLSAGGDVIALPTELGRQNGTRIVELLKDQEKQ